MKHSIKVLLIILFITEVIINNFYIKLILALILIILTLADKYIINKINSIFKINK